MKEPGPFDRLLAAGPRDRNARYILIGMGVLGVVLLLLVLPPLSLLSSGDSKAQPANGNASSRVAPRAATSGRLPKVPEGFEALSLLMKSGKPKGTDGPYRLTISLVQPVSDGRNLGLYTNKNGKWERVATATLINNGAAAAGEVTEIPANVAVFRRTTSAVQMSGWLPSGIQADPAALEILGTVNPVDFAPNADGALVGSATQLPATKANVVPAVRASAAKDVEAVNTILASPALREAHVTALVQLSLQPGNAGVDLDYRQVNPARKADFTAFVTVLADRLHQSNRTLSLTLPTPAKAGVSWDTGPYDWEELARRADALKLAPELDPSIYHKRMEEVLTFLKPKVDLRKVALVLTRQSHEKGTDGLRALSLREGLTLASALEVRTTSQITPNSSVVIIGKNIFQDDGASGLRWDESAFAVAFSYPGRGGQRTVWLENSLSVAFRLDLARRFGLGGIAVDDISLNPQAPAIWGPLRAYAETGSVNLAQPNGVLLRPVWQIQAGASEANVKGNIVWKAPTQPGVYDITLVISDGVIRAAQKLVLEVRSPGAATTSTPSPAGTPLPAVTPTVRP